MNHRIGARDALEVAVVVLLIAALAFGTGCGVGGNAKIRLQGMSLGTVTMDGRPVEGLPSQSVDITLDVSSSEIRVVNSDGTTTLNLNQEGATVEITPNGVVLKGFKPDQVRVEWTGAGTGNN